MFPTSGFCSFRLVLEISAGLVLVDDELKSEGAVDDANVAAKPIEANRPIDSARNRLRGLTWPNPPSVNGELQF